MLRMPTLKEGTSSLSNSQMQLAQSQDCLAYTAKPVKHYLCDQAAVHVMQSDTEGAAWVYKKALFRLAAEAVFSGPVSDRLLAKPALNLTEDP